MEVIQKVDDVARIIGVSPSTIKKYYSLFEQEGYRFKRSNEGYVLFSNHDIDLLKQLIVLKNQPEMTISKAVKQLIKSEVVTGVTDITDTTNDITVISNQVISLMSDITELKQLVKTQNEYIKNSQNDRDLKLVQSLRETQEVKKLLLEVKEEMAATQEKKSWWKKLFSK